MTKKVMKWNESRRTTRVRRIYDRFIPEKNVSIEIDGREIFPQKNTQKAEFHHLFR